MTMYFLTTAPIGFHSSSQFLSIDHQDSSEPEETSLCAWISSPETRKFLAYSMIGSCESDVARLYQRLTSIILCAQMSGYIPEVKKLILKIRLHPKSHLF